MNTLKTLVLFSIIQLLSFTNWSQDSEHFNGTLTYRIERVDVNDSSEAKMMIFARDSLLKIVNFSSEFGRQESITHLGYQKKYILIGILDKKNKVLKKTVTPFVLHKGKGSGGLSSFICLVMVYIADCVHFSILLSHN